MRDKQATKARIEAAALRLFVEKGVAETSVRDLALAAGIAEGTLYRHYASKDDLVAGLFAGNYQEFAARLEALMRPRAGFRAKLEAVVAEFCRFHDQNPTLFRFLLLVQHQALPRVPDGASDPVSVLHALIEEGIREGAISPVDAALGSSMVLGLMVQPATAIVYGRLSSPLARFAPEIAGACWRVLNPTGKGA